MTSSETLDPLVARATSGDEAALTSLLRSTEDQVYGLAFRMLGNPSDAEDAAQEILLRVATKLSTYRGEAAFTTWVYRVAANYLLTERSRHAQARTLTFERVADMLEQGLKASASQPEATDQLLVEECKLICTSGMLTCLEPDQRIAYVLGDILELPGEEAAAILAIRPATLRKRLERARDELEAFLGLHCGIADPANACRCNKQAPFMVQRGLIDPSSLLYAKASGEAKALARDIAELVSAAELFRSHPDYRAPEKFAERLRELIRTRGLRE